MTTRLRADYQQRTRITADGTETRIITYPAPPGHWGVLAAPEVVGRAVHYPGPEHQSDLWHALAADGTPLGPHADAEKAIIAVITYDQQQHA